MALLVGIDEAGYGPTLGPLVVSATALRAPDHVPADSIWTRLSASCARRVSRRERRLLVADSKKLFRNPSDLVLLERAVLVMLAVGGTRPDRWRGLLEAICPGSTDALCEYPWYADADPSLPLSPDLGDVATRANAVRADLDANQMALVAICSEPLWEGEFNRRVHRTQNKSTLLLGLVFRALRRAMASRRDEPVHVTVDRLGGRSHYRQVIALEFPGHDLQIVEESDTRSAYRLTGPAPPIDIEFVTEAESRFFTVALASVFSKYTRETAMRVFNSHWSQIAPDLQPTAGYYTDAHRWLRDAAPLLDRLSIRRELLIRER